MASTDEGEEASVRRLKQALDSDPNNPVHHFNLGLFLWERADEVIGDGSKERRDRAAEYFVAAAKLNPNDGAAFRFLGHYYSRVSVDAQRASKCYQRAVTLNPEDHEAGEGLCDLLDEGGKESLEVAVCKEAAEKSPRAFWAFQRLGYLQVHQKKWSEAVQSLQHAIRGYPACAELWEVLGFAYQRLGMFTAAVKSYGRAIELVDSRVFALIERGNILLMLGSFRQGIEQFRCALKVAPDSVSAHYGLASGLLGLAKECVTSGAFSWGAALLAEASEVAKSSTFLAGNLSSLWKLHGDIQIAYAKCFPWEDERMNIKIDEELLKASISRWKGTCISSANSAKLSYQRALHLNPWQANIYTDTAICLDLIYSLEERNTSDIDVWQLTARMSLGGLVLEGANNYFWVILGCLSKDYALKQHAFIRALQLDVSLSTSWSYIGKIYWKLGEQQLARQAFDRARSVDPSLALPWASMSVDCHERKCSPDEAFESCLRAVQILPLAEFQVGLGTLAARSGHLSSPQVFGAIKQAVQRAPYYPESHILNGLVCEARLDYQSAIAAYRQAQCALSISRDSKEDLKSQLADVSINLARSLCRAGHALDASGVCENLMKEGLLDIKALQIYAFSLWQLGKNDQALSVARNLLQSVSTMNQTCAVAALRLICMLTFCILGQDSAAANIAKLPRELLYTTKLRFLVCAFNALDSKKELQFLLPSIFQHVTAYDVAVEMRSLVAFSKMISDPSKEYLEVSVGVDFLRKALHMYPDSSLIRSQLSSLLLSSGDWTASHKATRCVALPSTPAFKKGSRSSHEMHGAAVVACYACCATIPKFSFPTCNDQQGAQEMHHLQKWVHQEPWSNKARYLLVLNVLQKAREEKFPPRLCGTLKRLVFAALSKEMFVEENEQYAYEKFLLLLCASEVSLQCGDYLGCISHATGALRYLPHTTDAFFARLQLCRAYAAKEDFQNLRNEHMNCLQLNTANPMCWISLKCLESRCKLPSNMDIIRIKFQECSAGKGSSWNKWEAVFDLVCGEGFILDQDFVSAEQALAHACSIGDSDSCLLLCHGSICMELARQRSGSEFLSHAVSSLTKAQVSSPVPLPIVSALLAQAEASLGAKAKWERNLHKEWFSWPAEMRPAELYFQMHLLAKQSNTGSKKHPSIESSQSPERWVLRAIHLNPSCLRYWKVLQKLVEL